MSGERRGTEVVMERKEECEGGRQEKGEGSEGKGEERVGEKGR